MKFERQILTGKDAIGVPPHTLQAIVEYVEKGGTPSGFLYAVLVNDLWTAATVADSENYKALGPIGRFVRLHVPGLARGDQAQISWWLQQFRCSRCKHNDTTRSCDYCDRPLCDDCTCCATTGVMP